jgi:hypothetical protein
MKTRSIRFAGGPFETRVVTSSVARKVRHHAAAPEHSPKHSRIGAHQFHDPSAVQIRMLGDEPGVGDFLDRACDAVLVAQFFPELLEHALALGVFTILSTVKRGLAAGRHEEKGEQQPNRLGFHARSPRV